MAEVGKVPGPIGPGESSKKDKAAESAQRFRDLMKVGETDPEQQKKRKHKQESQDEKAAGETGAPQAAPPAQAPSPFVPGKPKTGGPLKVGEAGKTGGLAAPSPSATPPPTEPEDESFMQTLPPAQTRGETPEKFPIGPPSTEMPPEKPSQEGPPRAEKPAEKIVPKAPPIKREPPVQAQPARTEEKREPVKQKKPEEIPEEVTAAPGAPPAPPPGAPAKEKKEKKAEETGAVSATPTPELLPSTPSLEPTPPPAYAYLHPQVLDLFERMVGVITVMNTTGVTETTVSLNAPEFKSSLFYGAEIKITEYSTAPKAFNVQIIASPQGIALIQANADDLMAAFSQAGGTRYRINRVDASLATDTDRPLFRRKEAPGEKGDKQ